MSQMIEFEKVSKAYRLGATHRSLRETIPTLVQRVLALRKDTTDNASILWALRDVSFSVKRGEALGIIGPNGAGKTTSLKLISKITKATGGCVRVHGRVSALIELGAGFHPDLTGRENIYLNGAILGMTHREIEQRFNDIVAFSELERFLDTPVKRYSSGMYCRLGFAVAAHVKPDILLTDEVLAVGDAAFQAKCYRRIAELKDAGTTIVFVTHALTVLRRVCDRALLLYRGKIVAEGEPAEVIATYQDNPQFASNLAEQIPDQVKTFPESTPKPSGPIIISGVTFLCDKAQQVTTSRTGESVTLQISYLADQPVYQPSVTIKFHGSDGLQYGGYNSSWDGASPTVVEGSGSVEVTFDPLCLLPGIYYITVIIADRDGLEIYDWHDRRHKLQVMSGTTTAHPLVYMPHTWHWRDVGEELIA